MSQCHKDTDTEYFPITAQPWTGDAGIRPH